MHINCSGGETKTFCAVGYAEKKRELHVYYEMCGRESGRGKEKGIILSHSSSIIAGFMTYFLAHFANLTIVMRPTSLEYVCT
jgi:hypothetical protein